MKRGKCDTSNGVWSHVPSCRAYYYTVETTATPTSPSQEVFGYHWHPQERNAITYPHLHLYQGAGRLHPHLLKAHLPTGRMAIEDILKLIITHFEVRPLRDDWETVLAETYQAFETWRTWP